MKAKNLMNVDNIIENVDITIAILCFTDSVHIAVLPYCVEF